MYVRTYWERDEKERFCPFSVHLFVCAYLRTDWGKREVVREMIDNGDDDA